MLEWYLNSLLYRNHISILNLLATPLRAPFYTWHLQQHCNSVVNSCFVAFLLRELDCISAQLLSPGCLWQIVEVSLLGFGLVVYKGRALFLEFKFYTN